MEVEQTDRVVVIAKPVASRPSFLRFKSFSEPVVAAVRPKAIRYRPQGILRMRHKLVSSSHAEVDRIHDLADDVQNLIPQMEADWTREPYKPATRCLVEEDNTSSRTVSKADETSYDGYHLRKYGQKQVKGSEYPRSYCKCTHPNCHVKKKIERSFDGQIAEIVFKGEHSHSKPHIPKRGSSATHRVLGTVPDDSTGPRSECRLENRLDVSSCGPSGSVEGRTKGMAMEDDRPRNKKRKSESQFGKTGISSEGTQQDGNVVVQSSINTDSLGDGFRWRKYGQKVVKGSPYPRSYYRCTSLNCNVRKLVERASDDPTSFVTTYVGKHSHELPKGSGNPRDKTVSMDQNICSN